MRTIDDITEEYLRDHPDEVDEYIIELFDEYAEEGDLSILLMNLRILCRLKGITATAQEVHLSRKGLQKALSWEGNPSFETVASILKAMGYKITISKL